MNLLFGQRDVQREQVEGLHHFLSLGVVNDYSLAIDGGAHVGTWAAVMAELFEHVIAFEPTPKTFSILVKNMAGFSNVECHQQALMDAPGFVEMQMPEKGKGRHRKRILNRKSTARYFTAGGDIPAVTIDGLKLSGCGLIKLDLEGAEPLAITGAQETIAKYHPALVVEIKKHSLRYGVSAKKLKGMISKMGYREVHRRRYDRFYIFQ